jgi:hypothetical protein
MKFNAQGKHSQTFKISKSLVWEHFFNYVTRSCACEEGRRQKRVFESWNRPNDDAIWWWRWMWTLKNPKNLLNTAHTYWEWDKGAHSIQQSTAECDDSFYWFWFEWNTFFPFSLVLFQSFILVFLTHISQPNNIHSFGLCRVVEVISFKGSCSNE